MENNSFTIDEIIAKSPKVKNGQELNNTQKRKIGIEKLDAIEYMNEYTQEQKDSIIALKKAFANNSMKSYQQLKLYSKSFEEVKSDLLELANAITQASDNGVIDTVIKLHLSEVR